MEPTPGLRIDLSVSQAEIEIVVEALSTLDAEYGLTDDGRVLLDRARALREQMRRVQ